MKQFYLYSWVITFFVVIPLITLYLVKGKRTTLLGKLYIFMTLTMFPLFFFGLSTGMYSLTLIAACYFALSVIITKRITWRAQ